MATPLSTSVDPAPSASDTRHPTKGLDFSPALLRKGKAEISQATAQLERYFAHMPPDVVEQHLVDAEKLEQKREHVARTLARGGFVHKCKAYPLARQFHRDAQRFKERVQTTSEAARHVHMRQQNHACHCPNWKPPLPAGAAYHNGFPGPGYPPSGGQWPYMPPSGYPQMYMMPNMYGQWVPVPYGPQFGGPPPMQQHGNTYFVPSDTAPQVRPPNCNCASCDWEYAHPNERDDPTPNGLPTPPTEQ